MSHGTTYLFLSEVTRGAEHCRDVSPLISSIIRTKDRRIPRKHLLAFTRHVRRGGLVRSIFFCGGLTQKFHIGSLLAHACAASADEPTRRQIGSYPFGRDATSAPVGRTCTCGADRRIRHSRDCACVQASPAGLSEQVSRPLTSRFACLGIKLKFQAIFFVWENGRFIGGLFCRGQTWRHSKRR